MCECLFPPQLIKTQGIQALLHQFLLQSISEAKVDLFLEQQMTQAGSWETLKTSLALKLPQSTLEVCLYQIYPPSIDTLVTGMGQTNDDNLADEGGGGGSSDCDYETNLQMNQARSVLPSTSHQL